MASTPRRRFSPKPKSNGHAEPAPQTVPTAGPSEPPPCAHASASEADAHAVALVREQQCAIIRACCEQAEAGSYLHAKFVFDFAGIAPTARGDAELEARERTLSERLLARLEDEAFCEQLSAAARAHPIE